MNKKKYFLIEVFRNMWISSTYATNVHKYTKLFLWIQRRELSSVFTFKLNEKQSNKFHGTQSRLQRNIYMQIYILR